MRAVSVRFGISWAELSILVFLDVRLGVGDEVAHDRTDVVGQISSGRGDPRHLTGGRTLAVVQGEGMTPPPSVRRRSKLRGTTSQIGAAVACADAALRPRR